MNAEVVGVIRREQNQCILAIHPRGSLADDRVEFGRLCKPP